jgi:methylamine dehydrogenase accessory protein MauD
MSSALLTAVLLLSWVAIAGLAFCVFALARQVGVLHERVAPVGALSMSKGPAVGERVPRLAATSVEGREVVIGAPRASGRRVLLRFVSAHCPICKVLLPVAKRFAREDVLDLILVGDAPLEEQRALIEKFELRGLDFINSPQVGLTFQVGKLPFAVLIGTDATLIAQGLVNSREHLESLVRADETGIPSIQTYLAAAKRTAEEAAHQH